MAKFKINDRHVQFCNAVAGGLELYKAYQEHMSPGKLAKRMTAAVHASRLMKQPEIVQLIDKARAARGEAITAEITRNVAKEFSETTLLTVDELDKYHCAIVQGLVEVEDVVQVYRWTDILDKNGQVVKRTKEANFMRIKRPPNIREKQISISELYKRNGNYAPSKIFGAMGKVNDEGEVENVERFVILSDGSKIPMLSST